MSSSRRCADPEIGTGVICETWALEAAVIPAKAGIYSANLRKFAVDGLDSRFRGNDCLHRAARKINFPQMTSIQAYVALRREIHAAQEVLEARVGA